MAVLITAEVQHVWLGFRLPPMIRFPASGSDQIPRDCLGPVTSALVYKRVSEILVSGLLLCDL